MREDGWQECAPIKVDQLAIDLYMGYLVQIIEFEEESWDDEDGYTHRHLNCKCDVLLDLSSRRFDDGRFKEGHEYTTQDYYLSAITWLRDLPENVAAKCFSCKTLVQDGDTVPYWSFCNQCFPNQDK